MRQIRRLPNHLFCLWQLSIAAISLVFIVCPQKSEAFKTFKFAGGNVHEQISREALLSAPITLDAKAFDLISKGSTDQDLPPNLLIDSHHFDNCKLDETKSFIYKCFSQITTDSATAISNKEKRKKILQTFGALLHPVQDFYSHANYVELKLKEDSNLTPENMPLVDWANVENANISASTPSIRTGFFTSLEVTGSRTLAIAKLKSQKLLISETDYLKSVEYDKLKTFDERIGAATNPHFSFLHNDLNKDNAKTDEGKTAAKVQGKLLYDYARSLAIRETRRQWEQLEAAVKEGAKKDADSLLGLLKKGL